MISEELCTVEGDAITKLCFADCKCIEVESFVELDEGDKSGIFSRQLPVLLVSSGCCTDLLFGPLSDIACGF